MIQHFVPSKCNDVNALVVSTQSVRGDNKMLIFFDRLTGGRTGLNLPLSDKSDFTSDYVNRSKWWWDRRPDSPLWSAPQMRQCEPLKCARGSDSTSGCSEISAELVVLLVSVLFTTWTFFRWFIYFHWQVRLPIGRENGADQEEGKERFGWTEKRTRAGWTQNLSWWPLPPLWFWPQKSKFNFKNK